MTIDPGLFAAVLWGAILGVGAVFAYLAYVLVRELRAARPPG